MGPAEGRPSLERMLTELAAHEPEFRELDGKAGDGDLGVTVRRSAEAAIAWLTEHPEPASWSELLAALADVCAHANPSTFGSLVSRGLAAAGKALEEAGEDDLGALVAGLEAGIATVRRRGGAEVGEKTFLDALAPMLEAARGAPSAAEALPLMYRAAVQGTEAARGLLAQHGRAAWVGERARGVPDAGSVVVIRALEALGPDAPAPWSVD